MKSVPGTPGTVGSLVLRMGQLGFAIAALAVMLNSPDFSNYTAFCYLVAAMGMQCLWSCAMGAFDSYALLLRRGSWNKCVMSLFAVGDWVSTTVSLAAACATAGVTVLFDRDLHWCARSVCVKYQLGTSLAFLSWILIAMSFILTFWLLATG